MKPTFVIYHSADYDGIFCRQIAAAFLPADTTFIGWNHGDPLIPIPVGFTYILDLSPDCLQDGELGHHVVWIDHHKTSMDKWGTSLPGYRIDGVAACRLTWQWFIKDHDTSDLWPGTMKCVGRLPVKEDFIERRVNEPWAVRLAGEYDIWDKRDPNAELFQHGLRSEELYKATWDALLDPVGDGTVNRLLNQGRALQYARTKENESVIKELGFTFSWEGLTFLACNAARFNSLLFTAGLKPEHDACFGFKWNGKDWSVSLYHAPGKEDIDLSAIAKLHGGGGHRGACGFRTRSLPFLPLNSPE